ncbi:MarR family winged helix-turn-helix transcriptional regulator [Martelella mediterranea]|uniref:MarR family transcriptional regulator n=1 Tax=Martelella mediterranea TaxID=293089 RepID=A0A4R3NGC5_9HYPH|nr:MarR family transcriptional regulator [Martelella mediterranea]TCT29632.1 MarR family transcriptional regulator [Martelella mediterranea]
MMNFDQTDERVAFMEALAVASRKMRTAFNARVSEHGLTFARARVLLLLIRHETCNQSALACELELEKPTVVRMLDRMAAIDLIERVPDPNDRRINLIRLRPHGEAMARTLLDVRRDVVDSLFRPEDEEALISATALFQTLIARTDAQEQTHAGK